MKLHFAAASPFVRKVRIVAIELGLAERVELVEQLTTPVNTPLELVQDNPLGKIPCLVPDDGDALYDSRVICAYLGSVAGGETMFPAGGAACWTALRRQALGDGLLDAGVLLRYETFLRPEQLRWPDWMEAQQGKIMRSVDEMAREVDGFGVEPDIGTIACAVGLGYIDFRFAELDWRAGRPELAAWYETMQVRPSFAGTAPE
jgi:glutathione S-transferase